jgi:hypothetical protein
MELVTMLLLGNDQYFPNPWLKYWHFILHVFRLVICHRYSTEFLKNTPLSCDERDLLILCVGLNYAGR